MTGTNDEDAPLYEVVSLTPQHTGIGTADEVGGIIDKALRNTGNLSARDGVRTALELRQSGILIAVVLQDRQGGGWCVINRLLSTTDGNPIQTFARSPARAAELVTEIAHDDVSHAADIDATTQKKDS